jgi:hypothetical protein
MVEVESISAMAFRSVSSVAEIVEVDGIVAMTVCAGIQEIVEWLVIDAMAGRVFVGCADRFDVLAIVACPAARS